jgi:hypothetical protein
MSLAAATARATSASKTSEKKPPKIPAGWDAASFSAMQSAVSQALPGQISFTSVPTQATGAIPTIDQLTAVVNDFGIFDTSKRQWPLQMTVPGPLMLQALNSDGWGSAPASCFSSAACKSHAGETWGFITDGCYARALKMAKRLQAEGFNVSKMFVRGNLSAQNGYQSVQWGWHVAVLVLINDPATNQKKYVLIDPSINSGNPIMAPEAWVASCHPVGPTNVQFAGRGEYYPMTNGKASGDTIESQDASADQTLQDYAGSQLQLFASDGIATGDIFEAPAASSNAVAAPTPAAPAPTSLKANAVLAPVPGNSVVRASEISAVHPDGTVELRRSARLIKATPEQAASLKNLMAHGKRVHAWVSNDTNPAVNGHTIDHFVPVDEQAGSP